MGFLFGNAGFLHLDGTPTLHLNTLIYTIQGQYYDPIKKSLQPLPPHYWALYQPGDPSIITCSGSSVDPETPLRAVGQCFVNAPDPFADGEYALAMYPIPNKDYIANQEAWIDLTTNKWVTPAPGTDPRLDPRKLLRLPFWTSVMKATYYGGGFNDAPAKAKDYFTQNGLLKKADIEAYGTKDKPWSIVLDFNWIKAHVRYVFVNWKDGKEENLPPGLVVEATLGAQTLGKGTAIDDADGTAYVLVGASQDKFKSLHFGFRAPVGVRVDLSSPAASPDTRLVSAGALSADRNTRNTLPNVWHSKGMPAVYSAWPTPPAAGAARKTWDGLRGDIAGDAGATEPLVVFQLDDVILYNKSKVAKVPSGSRMTLFDHLLRIRNPDSDPARPHFTSGTFETALLDQKQVYALGAPAPTAPTVMRDLSTRLVSFGTTFYDVEEKRVTGTPGKTNNLGARAALANDHPIADYTTGSPYIASGGSMGGPQIHLITVPGVQDPVASKQLVHMLLYVPCAIDENGVLNTAGAPTSGDLYSALSTASERWSQGSPGVTQKSPPTATKDYRIVSKDTTRRNSVIRPRAFFGPVADGGTMKIKMDTGGDRSNTGAPVVFIITWSNGKLTYYDTALKHDKAGDYPSGSDSDGLTYNWHTLTHEFGHVLGLPDEYGEELKPSDVDPNAGIRNPRVQGYGPPKEGMPTDYRPFFTDHPAMMKNNMLPRLRHYRHHVEALNSADVFAKALPDRPYVLRHETLGGSGIEYVRSGDEHAHPYVADFDDVSIPGGFGKCALFPVGQDEGVAEAMFAAQGAPAATLAAASRFDALLIVRARLRFRFDDAIVPSDRLKFIRDKFNEQIFDSQHRLSPGVRFGLTGGTKYPRVAVIIQPLYAYGVDILTGDDFKLIISSKTPPPANPFAQPSVGSTVELDASYFNVFTILRAILGAPTAIGNAGNTAALGVADFANVAKLADSKLAGTHVPVAI